MKPRISVLTVGVADLERSLASPVSIELKHLRYAEVAERCGSFRKAADLLALKQSNLSRRVRHLEEQLGVALFERTNGGVRPTLAGRDFVNGVRRALNELQMVVDRAKAAGRGEAGYLMLASTPPCRPVISGRASSSMVVGFLKSRSARWKGRADRVACRRGGRRQRDRRPSAQGRRDRRDLRRTRTLIYCLMTTTPSKARTPMKMRSASIR
jgi:hypothetical protein